MALAVGPTEQEREQMIVAMRGGASFEEATKPFRKKIEQDWFDRNEKHLEEVAAQGEKKAPIVDPPKDLEPAKGAKGAKG